MNFYNAKFKIGILGTFLAFVNISFSQKPNILFMISDDLNNAQSTYNWRMVKTPHIDKLAESGMRFDRAYCQGTECTTSRTSLTAGLYPNVTGGSVPNYLNNNNGRATIPSYFKSNGYYTARAGKIYHQGVPRQLCEGSRGPEDPNAWDDLYDPFNSVDCQTWEQRINAHSSCTHQGSCLAWLSVDSKDEDHSDGMVATEVIRLLSTRVNNPQPFFIGAGFYRPHVPFIAPPKYFDMYPIDQVELPPDVPNDLDDIPSAALIHKGYQFMSDSIQKHSLQGYYASVSLMDAQVGRIMSALDSLGFSDNTIVVFTSDHGYSLGEHEQWEKPSVFEEGARIPLIIRVPKMSTAGKSTTSLVELVDLFPTLTDYAEIPTPNYLIGRSIRPVLENPLVPLREFAVTWKTSNGVSIRIDDWRYSHYGPGGSWGTSQANGQELYDHVNDPNEYTNLIGRSNVSAIENQLTSIAEQVSNTNYTPVYKGCNDSTFEEYNPYAEVEDNTLCKTVTPVFVHNNTKLLNYSIQPTENTITFYFSQRIKVRSFLKLYDVSGNLIEAIPLLNATSIPWDIPKGLKGILIGVIHSPENYGKFKFAI